jgi:hypothetical protein
MRDDFHMTEEQWAIIEPLLRESESHAHEEFFESQIAKDLLREGSDETPGNILLRYLRSRGDDTAVRLFRAMELYQHEILRHDLAIAFHLGQDETAKKK